MSNRKKIIISLILAIILGGNLYVRSDMPPYGYPQNECSDNYWGIIIDVAHRWRNFDFTSWNRGIGGGLSLYESGQYPVLTPTNALAWFLNDDQFYLIKLIEPYVVGFFFMTILLWVAFETRWYVAIFGGFAYMGMLLSKSTAMAQSPYFLYGIALFPAMVLTCIKLSYRHIYLAAAGVGAILAMQFAFEGVTQTYQLLIWWTLFFMIHLFSQRISPSKEYDLKKENQNKFLLKTFTISFIILVLANIGIFAVQFFPTLHHFKMESSRMAGHYTINNFGIFKHPSTRHTLTKAFYEGIIGVGPVRSKAYLVFLLMCISLSIVHFGHVFTNAKHRKFVYHFWITTIIFFIIPSTAYFLVYLMPFLEKIFLILSYIGFRYGLHIMDFCMVLSICLICNDEKLSLMNTKVSAMRMGAAIIFLLAALMVGIIPLILYFSKNSDHLVSAYPVLQEFFSNKLKNNLKIFVKTLVIVSFFALKPRRKISHFIMAVFMLGIGFMLLLDCYKWYGKGTRSHFEEYQWTSPEHEYFRNAKGKYVMLYNVHEPQWMNHNYNLLYGVHGTAGFMAVPPLRLTGFATYFHNRNNEDIDSMQLADGGAKFTLGTTIAPESFTSYFPVDFVVIKNELELPYSGFEKTVDGDKYDVYERTEETKRVYFSDHLKVVKISDLILAYEKPRPLEVYISEEDAQTFSLKDTVLQGDPSKAKFTNFVQKKEDRLSFNVETDKEIFVIVPERYQKGWEVKVDGKRVKKFPAYYLFIGFKVPAGDHQITMKYSSPWFLAGSIINILSLAGMIILFKKYYSRGNPSGQHSKNLV